MRGKVVKKLFIGITVMAIALGLGGCSDSRLEAFMNTDLVSVMTSRVEANKAIANKLYVSGLISESEKNSIEKSIDKQMGAYLKDDLASNRGLQDRLFAAIVDWNAPSWGSHGPIKTVRDGDNKEKQINSLGYTEEDWNNNIITTYVDRKGYGGTSGISLFNGKGSTVKPITVIDSKTGELINERFGYEVYTLKPFNEMENDRGQISLDDVIERISAATKDKDKVDNSVLAEYFNVAKDENGKAVTLLDTSKRENQVLADSSGSSLVTDSKYEWEGEKLKEVTKGNVVTEKVSSSRSGFSTKDNRQRPGKDMVIRDATGDVSLMAIRFHEFNEEAVDNITKTLGMSPDQYLFTTYKGENRVYIMEYPVHHVSKIKTAGREGTEFESEFEQSNMGINLRTGKLIKYGTAWGEKGDEGVYFEDKDPYLSVKGAPNNNAEGQSAFVIGGETAKGDRIEIGENKAKVKTGRVILRDYLEATYAPEIVSGENMVVFGRKIRMLRFNGSKNDIVAKYYDKEGKELDDSPVLRIDDFADFDSLNKDNPSVRYIGRVGEAETSTDKVGDIGKGGSDDYSTTGIRDSLTKIDELKKYVVNEINPIEQFPGKNIGAVDYSKSEKPLFYAMTVKKNMFDTALFSGWINNSDDKKNSLGWWQRWLADENRGYQYKINKTSLEEYLIGNYTFELQQSGIVILDLETISKIQQDYQQQDKLYNMRWFRTTFVVLGWAIISYAFILLMAWVVDTNVDLGFNILEKISFGHWVAVKDAGDMPYTDLSKTNYVTFQSLIIKTMGISVVGILLILVNVVEVVSYLINMFGGIARTVSRLITGI